MRVRIAFAAVVMAGTALALAPGCGSTAEEPSRERPVPRDEAGARAAFMEVYPVFMHARCVNCHPAGDAPLVGDDSQPHPQNVKRGPTGRGLTAMRCANCHMDRNLAGLHMPPGNPSWHLPPADMPMVFEGMSPRELARQLKDPRKNGGMTLEKLVHHIAEDGLVTGCWNPGDGRTPPPVKHAEFAAKFRAWVEKGAVEPE